MFWFSVNWTFSRFEINYLERREVHEKKQEEAPQLHPRREGHHFETTSIRRGLPFLSGLIICSFFATLGKLTSFFNFRNGLLTNDIFPDKL